MNLNIVRIKIFISMVAAFFLCCSMSTKCNTPGPVTRVHGIVTDGVTGKPIANLPMEVSGSNNDPHYFITNADGSYYLKFNPERLVSYYLMVAPSAINNYLAPAQSIVTPGTDNLINYTAYPAINVAVHLINHSNYGQNSFQLITIDSLAINNGYVNILNLKNRGLLIDTIARYQMAHYTRVSFNSYFFTSDGQVAKSIKQTCMLGNTDTLININNP